MSITSFTAELPTFLDIANKLERAFAGYAETREALFVALDAKEVAEANLATRKVEATLKAWAEINKIERELLAPERDALLDAAIDANLVVERGRAERRRADYEQARMRDDIAYQQLGVAKRLAELAIAAAHQP